MSDLDIDFSDIEDSTNTSLQTIEPVSSSALSVDFSDTKLDTFATAEKKKEITPVSTSVRFSDKEMKDIFYSADEPDQYSMSSMGMGPYEIDSRIEDAFNKKVLSIDEQDRKYKEEKARDDEAIRSAEVAFAEGDQSAGYALEAAKKASKERTSFKPKSKEELEQLRNDIYYMSTEDDNVGRRAITNAMLDKGFDLETISWTVLGTEIAPITGGVMAALEIPETAKIVRELYNQGDYISMAPILGMQLFDIGAGVLGVKAASKGARSILGTKDIKKRVRNKDRIVAIKAVEAEMKAKALAEAKKVAKANSKLKQDLIKEFEENTGKIISDTKTNKKGVETKTINQDKARIAGNEINEELYAWQEARKKEWTRTKGDDAARKALNKKFKDEGDFAGTSDEQIYRDYVKENDMVVNPVLNPDKLDSLIAVAAYLGEKKPKIFKRQALMSPSGKIVKEKGKIKKESFSDMIFRLAVNNEFGDDDALAEALVKYGLSYDDFMLAAVGSSTKAGQILNRFSQASRAVSPSVTSAAKDVVEAGERNPFVQGFLRFENIRRGSMTSMVKTAMRNAQSGMLLMPAEVLTKGFDNTLLSMTDAFREKGIGSALAAGAKTVTPFTKAGRDNWSGATRSVQRLFGDPRFSKQLAEVILDRPEFEKDFLRIRDNINEYRKYSGRGKGGVADATFSKLEDVVDVLQIPNKIQEYMIRHAAFNGELERLLKREYKVELLDVLEEGGIQDLISNTSKYRPKGARTFEEIVSDSTDHALEMTYASMPDNAMLANATRFITNNGLTVFVPFPRFMFKSLEMMAQFSVGAGNPLLKRVAAFDMKKPLTKNERKYISRNIVGAMAITAAAGYRSGLFNSDDVPADYKKMNAPDGTVIDTTAQFPLRQFLWFGEAARRIKNDTFNDWFNKKEATETFFGQSFRTCTGNIFIQEMADILSGAEDPAGQSKAGKALGRIAGDYISSVIVPLTQVVDAQRATGYRTTEYADYAEDTTDQGFFEGVGTQVKRSLGSRGFLNITDPSSDKDRPRRESIFSSDRKRENVALNLGLGISTVTRDDEYAEYIQGMGFTEFELSSKSRTPSIRNRENKLIRDRLPILAQAAKQLELQLRVDYFKLPDSIKKRYKQDAWVNMELKDFVKEEMKGIRSSIRELRTLGTSDAVVLSEKFGRLGKNKRKVAISRFYSNFNEPPNLSDAADLETLIELSKQ